MSAGKHTAGPWDQYETDVRARHSTALIADTATGNGEIDIDIANAAFIVKACNAHDELVAALGVAIECMRTTAETGDDGASDQCIAECLAVLGKVTP